MGSDLILDPLPILIHEYFVSESISIVDLKSSEPTSPLEYGTVCNKIPSENAMVLQEMLNLVIRPLHEISKGLGIKALDSEHLSDEAVLQMPKLT